MGYLPFIVPALALAVTLLARPPALVLVLLAVVAVAAEYPVGVELFDAGGIECPRGCNDEQELFGDLFFLALPLTAIILLLGAVVSTRRRRRGS